jgi:rhodanese-related sulfurtransferase
MCSRKIKTEIAKKENLRMNNIKMFDVRLPDDYFIRRRGQLGEQDVH